MPPDANLPVPVEPSGWLANTLGPLAHIPGAVGAIARLVGKSAEAGEAWIDISIAEGQRRAQAIRDDRDARSSLVRAISMAAAERAKEDPELADRAIAAWAGNRVREQANREAVAEKTIEMLKGEPPPQDAPGPTDDWMNVFEAHAEKASSDALRLMWAKVLSGELRAHGTISLRTIQFVSILDKQLANTTERVAGFKINGNVIIAHPHFEKGRGFEDINLLDSHGLVVTNSQVEFQFPDDTKALIPIADDGTFVLAYIKADQKYAIPGATITAFGREVLSLIKVSPDPLMIGAFETSIKGIFGDDAVLVRPT